MPIRRYLPQPFAGTTTQTNGGLPTEAQDELLATILQFAKGGVKSYHIGSRGLERYALNDYMALWSKLGQIPDALTGTAIKVRRGVPTDT
jgi:hypothetical protein